MTLAGFFRSEWIDRRISELRMGDLNPQVLQTSLCGRRKVEVVNSSTKATFRTSSCGKTL